ncbi:hypothetical protein CHARACLAT_015738 [Characodon lateralis]|uniref:Uncharacterized protein n=1 Tax=Characodon lateralis TaxID=208331 RepID=A0ABU7DV09_9TELE|nr:hypothetical protein [Characodon lateralis]
MRQKEPCYLLHRSYLHISLCLPLLILLFLLSPSNLSVLLSAHPPPGSCSLPGSPSRALVKAPVRSAHQSLQAGWFIDRSADASDASNVAFHKEQSVATATTNPDSHPLFVPIKLMKKNGSGMRTMTYWLDLFNSLEKMIEFSSEKEIHKPIRTRLKSASSRQLLFLLPHCVNN